MRYTPELIEKLEENEVFVFGSNERGIHGAGAAAAAQKLFGAVYGVGFGLQGQSFAIPTKDWAIDSLPLETISFYIDRFVDFARMHPQKTFLVTKIGCGLACFTVEKIAPLFTSAMELDNVVLPKEFVTIIKKRLSWKSA
jgi:hypothetical protein